MAFAMVVVSLLVALPCYAGALPEPNITSVSTIYAEQYQTITITGIDLLGPGSNFGDAAGFFSDVVIGGPCSSFPCSGTSTAIELNDITGGWAAGYGGDGIGIIVDSWTDTQIVLGGFGGSYISYGPTGFELLPGDQLQIDVWNSDYGSNESPSSGQPDPTYPVGTIDATVVAATPEPSSIVLMLSGLLALAFVALRKRFGVALAGTR
jgi:hypothetical protein